MPLSFSTPAQTASLSTTSAAALRAKGVADGVKNGTYVGGGTAADVNIKSVDTKVGAIALTTALWYLRTGDSSYLGPLKTFIRATPKPPDGTQALNEMRGMFGIFAAVKLLKDAGAWTASDDSATCPNHNGDTWTQFLLGGGSQSGPYHLRTVGGANLARSLRGTDPGVDKTANNWGAVFRATHLAYAALVNNTSEIDHSVKRFKHYLGDRTTGLADYTPTSDYISSWDNWGTPAVKAGVGKYDPANPGLDGVIVDDICRGGTGYAPGSAYYGSTAKGLTYPLEAADYVWAQAAILINGGYDVRSMGEHGDAFNRMNARFARKRIASEPSLFDYTEGAYSVYKGGRYIASQLSQVNYSLADAPATSSGSGGLSRSMPYGDWLAPADGSSTWAISSGGGTTPTPEPDPTPDPTPSSPFDIAATSIAESTSATSLACTIPTGTVAGDLLLAFVAGPAQAPVTTAPSGWTLVASQAGYEANALTGISVFKRVATGTEAASYTFTSTATANRMTVEMLRITGANTSTFDAAIVSDNGATASSYTEPSVTTATAGAIVLHFVSIMSSTTGATDVNTPTGMTREVGPVGATGGGGRRAPIFSEIRPTAGATGLRAWTLSGTPVQWASIAIAVRSATGTAPPALTGSMSRTGSGTLSLSGSSSASTQQSGTIQITGSGVLTRTAKVGFSGTVSTTGSSTLGINPTILGTLALDGETGQLEFLGVTSYARLVYRALEPIYLGDGASTVRAYNDGDIVPDSVVAAYGLEYLGLVERVALEEGSVAGQPQTVTSVTISRIEYLSSEEYDAMAVKAPTTLYITF